MIFIDNLNLALQVWEILLNKKILKIRIYNNQQKKVRINFPQSNTMKNNNIKKKIKLKLIITMEKKIKIYNMKSKIIKLFFFELSYFLLYLKSNINLVIIQFRFKLNQIDYRIIKKKINIISKKKNKSNLKAYIMKALMKKIQN